MIDWFRGEVPFQHRPLPTGHLLSLSIDGEEEWVSPKRLDCRSTHETNLVLRSAGSVGHGYASSLLIDGNLAKFLQGHNAFGSRNMNALVAESFRIIYQTFEDHSGKRVQALILLLQESIVVTTRSKCLTSMTFLISAMMSQLNLFFMPLK